MHLKYENEKQLWAISREKALWPSGRGTVFRILWGSTRVGPNPVIGTTNRNPTADSAVHPSQVVGTQR